MLDVEVFANDKNNDWLVRQFESYQFSSNTLTDKFIPRPYISIIFHFKDCPLISDKTSVSLEPYFCAPIVPKALSLQFQGNMDTLAINCKATVFSRVFGLDLSPVRQQSIQLSPEIFYPVWKSLAGFKTTADRILFFNDFINAAIQYPYIPDAVDLLYEKILEKSISHPMDELMGECFASRSTLFRKFVKRTGVSPKTLARIVRLDYLWAKIRDENATDYLDLIFDCKYFDQAHFINDFKAIIGETPGFFLKRNLDTVKMFAGKPSVKI
jgi:AraC-like DNA-binding protein